MKSPLLHGKKSPSVTAKEWYRDLARAAKRRIAKFAENRREMLAPGYGEALIALQHNEDSESEKA